MRAGSGSLGGTHGDFAAFMPIGEKKLIERILHEPAVIA